LLVAILFLPLFLLNFLKQTETTRFEKVFEFADAGGENSSRRSRSGGHHCYAGDACWTHYFLLRTSEPPAPQWGRGASAR
jgi:hypothetical protein